MVLVRFLGRNLAKFHFRSFLSQVLQEDEYIYGVMERPQNYLGTHTFCTNSQFVLPRHHFV